MGVVSGSSVRYMVGALVYLAAPAGARGQGAPGAGAESARAVAAPRQRVTLDLRDVPLRDALKAVAAQGGASLVYDGSVVPLDRRVTARVTDATAGDALRALLRDTDVEVRETASGQLLLVRRAPRPRRGEVEAPAPEGTLGGRVTDSASAAPVASALVLVDGGGVGGGQRTTTDEGGRYRLAAVPAGTRTVTVRRIGYAPATRTVTVPESGAATLDVALAAVASRLEEVVTTVTGPQRRLEVGNAIGTIAADSVVREAPVTSLADVINARVPGAQVVMNNGQEGSSPRVRIRGLNSPTVTNNPLLVVDGVRVENGAGAQSPGGFGQTSGRFNDLNPNEIESIEIVKGPSAATLYGTDAANGVIVVRTKRGRPGPIRWDAYAERGITDEPARFPDNYYSWGHDVRTGAARQCLLVQAAAGACAIDSLTRFNPLMDRATTPLGKGSREQYGLQASGGVSQFNYFLSGEYENALGFLRMPAPDLERVSAERGGAAIPEEQRRPNATRRVSLRANVGANAGARADVGLSFGVLSGESRIPGDAVFRSGAFGRGYRDAQNGWFMLGAAGAEAAPGEAFALRNAERVTHYTTGLTGNWRPRDWLSARGTAGLDFSSTALDALQKRDEGPLGVDRNGRRINQRTDVSQYTADIGASALFSPRRRLSSRTSIGIQFNRRLLAATMARGTNLPPGSETVTGAAVLTGTEQNVESVVAGAYAEETIGLAERLYLTAALRADGGSAFGSDFRTALYPKASASWLVVSPASGGGSSLRFRAAFGSSGVQPAPTAALALVAYAPATVNGTSVTGARVSAIGNPDLKPERQTELEGGLDAELLRGRMRAELTYYDRISRDALINHPLATDIGILTRQENLGSVSNRGVEGLLSVTLVDAPALAWDVNVNGSVNRNRLERIRAGIPFVGQEDSRSREGYPLFSRFARPILGYADANGNGIIESGEVQVGDSLVYVGPSMPTRQLTLGSGLSLLRRRLRVTTQFDYRGGNTQFRSGEVARCGARGAGCRAINDPTAPLAEQAAAVAVNTSRLGNTQYGYFTDGAFVRWRELAVTYALPESAARVAHARALSVTIAGRNLRLFTRYPGVDPEVNAQLDSPAFEGYYDYPAAPLPRYWNLRVNLGL